MCYLKYVSVILPSGAIFYRYSLSVHYGGLKWLLILRRQKYWPREICLFWTAMKAGQFLETEATPACLGLRQEQDGP